MISPIIFRFFTILNQSTTTDKENKSKIEFYRKETKHNIDLMKFALTQEEWHDVLQEPDADIAYEHFIHKLLSYYNKYIPLVKTKTSIKKKKKATLDH